MAPNSSTPSSTPVTPKCAVCGKTLTRAQSQQNGVGHTCAQLQAKFTPAQLQAHYQALQVNAIPAGYVPLASFKGIIAANKSKVPGLTIAALLRAIGKDRAINPALHPIAKPVYGPKNWRYVHPWLATPAGLKAIATGNFAKAPNISK